jgi:sulfur-oxidizing protein SoxY
MGMTTMQGKSRLWLVVALWLAAGAHARAETSTALSAQDARDGQDVLWNSGLRSTIFSGREIVESDDVVTLEVPERAENAAIVPITIRAQFPQSAERSIRTVWLVIDKNPGPLAGTFHFTPQNGRADLDLRIRINEYTPVRAIAETSDGRLTMSRRYVKASGGCSAPASGDLGAALARMGQMKIRTTELASGEPASVHLLVSHPNLNGLQMDQLTGLYTPAKFVKEVRVSFEGDEIFAAETSFAISENPSFEFRFVPEHEGELTAEVVDTDGTRWSHTQHLELAARSSQR